MISEEEYSKLTFKNIGFATWNTVKHCGVKKRKSFLYKLDVGIDEDGMVRTYGYWPVTPMNILRWISYHWFDVQLDEFLRKLNPFKARES